MALSHFEVTGKIMAAVTDSSADPDGNPDYRIVSATLTFTPSVHQAYHAADDATVVLTPLVARTNLDTGEIETIDGNPVSLVDTVGLDVNQLTYTLAFSNVQIPGTGKVDGAIKALTITAPGDGETVTLNTAVMVYP